MDNETDILIVEDSPTQAERLRYVLEQHEYRVSSARNGMEALALLQQRRPRVVISDVIMPEMDGFELCRRIRADQTLRDLPFIVLTTLADPKDVIRALECGATNFISKPYEEHHLISRIHHVLANYELRRDTRVEMGVSVYFAGEQHYITAERLQILDLLLTTYETAVRENAELARVRDELQRLNESLEQQVAERTEQVRQREALYRTLAENAQDDIFLIGPDLRIQYMNPFTAGRFGRRPEDVVGQPLTALFPAEAVAWQTAELQKVLDTGQARYVEGNLRFPGEERWLGTWLVPVRDAAGRVEKAMGISRDLTERRREEQQREVLTRVREKVRQMQQEEDIEQVLVAVREGLEQLRIPFAGCGINVVEMVAGAPVVRRHEMSSQSGWWTVEGDPAGNEQLARFWRGGQVVYRKDLDQEDPYQERKHLPPRRSVVDVPFSHGTLAINSEQPHAFSDQDLAFLEQMAQVLSEGFRRLADLKALAEAEARFHQAQKLESLGRLAGGVAHDFNNLLTIITGNTQLLLRHAGDPETPLHSGLCEIQDAGMRAVALVRQLLVFSRRQVLQRQVLNLNQLLTDIGRMLRRVIGEDVELVMALEPELGQVEADPGQMEQVLMNLAVNARDAMPQGGKLVLETLNVALDGQYLASHALQGEPGPYVLLSVSDTGIGMTPEVQAQIFEPFFTTKEAGKGTGLGLATVYGVVRQSGGHIGVYSEVGHGTTFKIYLPAVGIRTERPTVLPEPAALESQSRGDGVVLVAEDEEGVRRLAVRTLQEHGYTVLEAANGAEAVEVLAQQTPALRLLLTDVVMPGMLGRELADRVRRSYPQLKVLFMSGYSEHTALPPEVQTSAEGFLQKPFDHDTLLRRVRQALG